MEREHERRSGFDLHVHSFDVAGMVILNLIGLVYLIAWFWLMIAFAEGNFNIWRR